MNFTNIDHYKQKLEAEKAKLLGELQELGRINPTNPKDWETTYSNLHPSVGSDEISAEPDSNDQADLIEEYELRNATEVPLEARMNEVLRALERIEKGTFGLCTVDEPHPIEEGRLEANPAATTCMKHK
jgi:RNA polymerase-binding transcription factor DksA